jgi:hypothetical protein
MSVISSISPAAAGLSPGAGVPVAASGSSAAALPSALQSGASLINGANTQLNQDAAAIADPSAPDLTAPLLDLDQSLFMAEAGAAVVDASDRMLGSILDVFA